MCLLLSHALASSTHTNRNKHSCHSGLLLRASESLQMGTAKCWCHSASVPKKQGHLLWSQVMTGHLHTHVYTQTYSQTCRLPNMWHTVNAHRNISLRHSYTQKVTRLCHLNKEGQTCTCPVGMQLLPSWNQNINYSQTKPHVYVFLLLVMSVVSVSELCY